MKAFIREKVIDCGTSYREVDIVPYTENQQEVVKQKRKTKEKVTAPKQRNYNDRRAKRYFVELANHNFWRGDYIVDLTYDDEYLPVTFDEAHKNAVRFLDRLAYRRKVLGLPALKYLLVTAEGELEGGTKRFHHHLLINGGLDREEVENTWWVEKGTKKNDYNDRVYYGWANVRGLQPNKKGISNRAGYMSRISAGKKLWTQSQNLDKPYAAIDDNRYTRRQIEKIAKLPPDCEEYKAFWEKKYKGWELVETKRVWNDITGWSFYHIFNKLIL